MHARAHTHTGSDLDVSVHGGGLRSPDQSLQLGAAVVLGLHSELLNVYITGKQAVLSHHGRVDVEDLDSALLIRQTWRKRGENGFVS